ncbi:MAG: hypothetical protein H6822_25845 [Planctomycetaceae bacterium]|nr:hypothetical protein [Planctomycetaceae bacterium]
MATTIVSSPSVRDLRRRWKPIKERLSGQRDNHPTLIRFHRACSWLARVEQMGDEIEYDLALILQWVAFNALYGQWDESLGEPLRDRECWRVFADRVLDLDSEDRIRQILLEHKRLVLSLLEDEYLSKFFWEDPGQERAGKARSKKYKAQSWFVEGSWKLIVEQILERIYLMRCQLSHGAATFGGTLNRTSLRRCSTMMDRLLPTMMLVFIDHGGDEDWGIMCYPPMKTQTFNRLRKPR